MAVTEQLPADVLQSVAEKIRTRLGSPTIQPEVLNAFAAVGPAVEADETPLPAVELAETFAVWTLGAEALQNAAGAELAQLAQPTQRFHHQIKFAGEAKAFARTLPLGEDAQSWSVREFAMSPLADLTNQAIVLTDEQIPDDKVARLLLVPAYQVCALWFVNENGLAGTPAVDEKEVLIISAPEENNELRSGRFLSGRDFLKALTAQTGITGFIE
jgi:hypothetical protein